MSDEAHINLASSDSFFIPTHHCLLPFLIRCRHYATIHAIYIPLLAGAEHMSIITHTSFII